MSAGHHRITVLIADDYEITRKGIRSTLEQPEDIEVVGEAQDGNEIDPCIMQFNQLDSVIPEPYNALDWNRYAYARNNPLKYTDPSGHIPWPLIFVLLLVSTLPGDTGPYPPNPGSELIGDMALRTFDPIDALIRQGKFHNAAQAQRWFSAYIPRLLPS